MSLALISNSYFLESGPQSSDDESEGKEGEGDIIGADETGKGATKIVGRGSDKDAEIIAPEESTLSTATLDADVEMEEYPISIYSEPKRNTAAAKGHPSSSGFNRSRSKHRSSIQDRKTKKLIRVGQARNQRMGQQSGRPRGNVSKKDFGHNPKNPHSSGNQQPLVNSNVQSSNVKDKQLSSPKIARKVELLKCPFCFKTFSGTETLIQHLATHKTNDNNQSKRPSSHVPALSLDEVENSIKMTSDTSTDKIKTSTTKQTNANKLGNVRCHKCGVYFTNQCALHKHMRLHSKIGRPWKCHRCNCYFMTKNCLSIHVKTRHGIESNSKCPVCSRSFKYSGLMEQHMRFHSKIGRPWKCSQCDCYLKTEKGLRIHESKSHGRKRTEYNYYNCKCPIPACRANLSSNSKLKHHMKIHEEANRPFKCSRCPSFFLAPGPLCMHENKVHDGPIKLPCNICGKLLPRSKLTDHLSMHRGENSYKCRMCDLSYRQIYSLQRHFKHRHGEMKTISELKLLCDAPSSPIKNLRGAQGDIPLKAALRLQPNSGAESKSKTKPAWHNTLRQLKPCKLVLVRSDEPLATDAKAKSISGSAVGTKSRSRSQTIRVRRPSMIISKKSATDSNDVTLDAPSRKRTRINYPDRTQTSATKSSFRSRPDIGTKAETPTRLTYTCPYCFKLYFEPKLLISHLATHTGDKTKEKDILFPKTKQKSMTKPKTSNEPQLKNGNLRNDHLSAIPDCNTIKQPNNSKFDKAEQNTYQARRFKCSKCSCFFPTIKNLKTHEKSHQKRNKSSLSRAAPTHKCQDCEYSSKYERSLMFHMEHHKEEGRPFKCVHCKFTFATIKNLRMHISRTHKFTTP